MKHKIGVKSCLLAVMLVYANRKCHVYKHSAYCACAHSDGSLCTHALTHAHNVCRTWVCHMSPARPLFLPIRPKICTAGKYHLSSPGKSKYLHAEAHNYYALHVLIKITLSFFFSFNWRWGWSTPDAAYKDGKQGSITAGHALSDILIQSAMPIWRE